MLGMKESLVKKVIRMYYEEDVSYYAKSLRDGEEPDSCISNVEEQLEWIKREFSIECESLSEEDIKYVAKEVFTKIQQIEEDIRSLYK